ncbi:nitrite reductase small subunit NirD [Leeuwenhoekiella marinoflava]|uniref:Nitrite reductase (NADH) small subunit n=2 Tax=Leeuwenhoekiella marinoflava TaxID=988 RepID=A0A4Q0PP57_9FLAO|nr:nitrite reductase small subunit NirD [Leeuwenhoekiella marinoflava]RXG32241.1 nitrite reductase (NADH) small subunit [Leeuwenhoekiella marinoflava]SHE82184.1 nitrite reductase (NADH) small subunit [Leeuwenhoekiella marinoflava DSM 3653]
MEELLNQYKTVTQDNATIWFKVGKTTDFPANGGACIKHQNKQIAVYNFSLTSSWYACQNLCPHKMEMVLSRGMIGDREGIPKVACPLHKKTFSLEDGSNLNGEDYKIAVYPVKIEDEMVYIGFAE